MNVKSEQEPAASPDPADEDSSAEEERILCKHCLRTANNGIRCLGMCVADSEY